MKFYLVFVSIMLTALVALGVVSAATAQGPAELEALGVPAEYAMWIGVALLILRGAMATLSTHVPDEKLGRAAPFVNRIGGNVKHAANTAAKLFAGLLFAGLLLGAPSVATAADCNFGNQVDGKVVRFSWPPAMALPWRVIDLEFGMSGLTTVCTNASSDLRVAVCEIPFVRDTAGWICPKAPDDAD